ncbi:MAG: hypothetical protein JWQ79_2354 [Mucilaginibacter sp.]|nr:hypothetical protein [Mucilaginibacter sp.]
MVSFEIDMQTIKDPDLFNEDDGVSTETLGYFIFKNEGILQILAQGASKKD